MLIINALILGSIVLMLARVYQPWVDRPQQDKVLADFKIPLRARIRLQRINAYAIVAVMLLAAISGQLNPVFELLAMALAMAVLLLPIHYTLTNEGVVLGRTEVRRWSEFAGIEEKPGRVRLIGADDWRGMDVWLPRTSENGEITALLRHRVASARRPTTNTPKKKGAVVGA